jgi:hypothetical protein
METTVYDLARMLKGLTGCTIVPWQYVPDHQSYGKQNDAIMKRCADFGEELDIGGIIDGREKPGEKLFLCVFREDFEAGAPFRVHLYRIRPEVEEMVRQRSRASSSFGDLFAAGLVQ